ncbi:hypothetical protein Goklo_018175 [Gossypium klotzschianum]|uniref:Uncharacterized protein n=1 Tax=Gossypium klotzschianum TaxID=34286 RepID=A0A7J8UK47_9ROSI|nr:hypothetical protein [Gossypium klotzschianum]
MRRNISNTKSKSDKIDKLMIGVAHNLAREAMREESRAYLIGRVLERRTSDVDLRRRREPG